jgi:predicted nuclease of restriction endonuclease-like (RecB) superfamily
MNEMKKNSDYSHWITELKARYLQQRAKAVVAVNSSLLQFYWNLGKDISEKNLDNKYGSQFYKQLSNDLTAQIPNVKGFSPTNLKYTKYFFELYCERNGNRPQAVDDLEMKHIFSIPWGHHRFIIDKCHGNSNKALFFVQQTIEHNWSRNVLLNFLDTDLFERKGKAITNFRKQLPEPQGDLAQEITKDPYNFDFLTLTDDFNERELENALVDNMTRFLMELGKGFSFMGKQYRIRVGQSEFFIDLLFYNTRIHAYCVIELKATTFKPEHLGQLSFYVSAVNHELKSEIDNPTIGILICKDKDEIVAKYALDTINSPIGISEYQLSKLYPADFKSSLPTIEEIEKGLNKSKLTVGNKSKNEQNK